MLAGGMTLLDDPRADGLDGGLDDIAEHEGAHLWAAAADSLGEAFRGREAGLQQVTALVAGVIRASMLLAEAAHDLKELCETSRRRRPELALVVGIAEADHAARLQDAAHLADGLERLTGVLENGER